LFSFPTTLSVPSHPLSPLAFTCPSLHPPTCHHTLPPSYTLTTFWPIYCTNFIQPQTLQSLTQAPYTTMTEIQQNTHKGHKTQKPPHCFPYSPTPLPTSPFSATLTNFPNFYS
jgi:hypothetical protein